MTLREFGRVVWFNKWLVLVVAALVTAGGYVYGTHQEPSYQAVAAVEYASPDSLNGAGIKLDTDPAVIESQSVIEAARTSMANPSSLRTAVGAYGTTANVVGITVTATGYQDALQAANGFAKAYVATLDAQFKQGLSGLEARRDQLGQWLTQNQAAATAGTPGAAVTTAGAQYASTMSQYQAMLMQIGNAQVLVSAAHVRNAATTATLVSIPLPTLLVVAGLLGLFLGIAAAAIRHALDTRVRSATSVRRAGARMLGTVSAVGASERFTSRAHQLPVAQRSATPFTQSVRELRTALQAGVDGVEGTVVVVTSTEIGGTCSFLAANLAASFALSGRRTVAVEGDLRQPRLTDLLVPSGSSHRADALGTVETSVPNLRVRLPLRTDLDPADFLASDRVRDMLLALRAGADVVVLDAPPALVAADAAILGAYADGVVLVVREGVTPLAAVEEASARLRAANAHEFGVVIATDRAKSAFQASYTYVGDAKDSEAEDVAPPPAPTADAPGPDAAAPREQPTIPRGVGSDRERLIDGRQRSDEQQPVPRP